MPKIENMIEPSLEIFSFWIKFESNFSRILLLKKQLLIIKCAEDILYLAL